MNITSLHLCTVLHALYVSNKYFFSSNINQINIKNSLLVLDVEPPDANAVVVAAGREPPGSKKLAVSSDRWAAG